MALSLTPEQQEAAFPAEERRKLQTLPLAELAEIYESSSEQIRQIWARLRAEKYRNHGLYSILRDRLARECPNQGLLAGTVVYRASKDRKGMERIEITDPNHLTDRGKGVEG